MSDRAPLPDHAASQTLGQIVEAVTAVEPELPANAVHAAVAKTTSTRHGLNSLARHLRQGPDLLVCGASSVPPLIAGLIGHLRAEGARQVQPPRCASCQQPKQLRHRVGDERVCNRCYDRHHRPRIICAGCGHQRTCSARTPDGAPLCAGCRQRDPASHRPCSRCGKLGHVHARTPDGPICRSCYQPPQRVCQACGTLGPIAARRHGQAVCFGCYEWPRRQCGQCGRVRRISQRAISRIRDLCDSCARWPEATCTRCGQQALCDGFANGQPVCLRCRVDERLTRLLTGPDGQILPALRPLRDAMAADNPRTVLRWLHRSPAVDVLVQLANRRLPLTHAALDQLPPRISVNLLRELLVVCGALPARDPELAALELLIDQHVQGIANPQDAQVLRAFATWHVLRHLRQRRQQGKPSSHRVARTTVIQAARFLTHLRQQGRGLADCTQTDVDRWLAEARLSRRWVRPFLSWATARGLTPKAVEVPWIGSTTPPQTTDDQAYWAVVRRLLHDDTIPVALRVAGLLVTLYGQRVIHITCLEVEAVIQRDGEVFLQLGRDELRLTEPLSSLVVQLLHRPAPGVAGQLVGASRWLFPGRRAGHHLHPEHLRKQLTSLGIECRASRNTALLQLAGQLPPVVLADLLGLHRNTATRWVQLAGGDWTGYVAARRQRGGNDPQISASPT